MGEFGARLKSVDFYATGYDRRIYQPLAAVFYVLDLIVFFIIAGDFILTLSEGTVSFVLMLIYPIVITIHTICIFNATDYPLKCELWVYTDKIVFFYPRRSYFLNSYREFYVIPMDGIKLCTYYTGTDKVVFRGCIERQRIAFDKLNRLVNDYADMKVFEGKHVVHLDHTNTDDFVKFVTSIDGLPPWCKCVD